MNTYNVFIGAKKIMEEVEERDLKHKLEFLRVFFPSKIWMIKLL